mmetsp:Transcript_32096/g.34524  ORF Transcript_32096/g.34524 Transcript_32096/m.34524 type:complete len:89 (-) Transcript_32096:247-513(-)
MLVINCLHPNNNILCYVVSYYKAGNYVDMRSFQSQPPPPALSLPTTPVCSLKIVVDKVDDIFSTFPMLLAFLLLELFSIESILVFSWF